MRHRLSWVQAALAFGVGALLWAAHSPANAAERPLPRDKPPAPEKVVHESQDPFDILSPDDVVLYRTAFDLQQSGEWGAADRIIARISDDVLMGHVLFQRFMHPTDYRSGFNELTSWMRTYRDHPGANRIYRLAQRRKPQGARGPVAPQIAQLETDDDEGEAIELTPPPTNTYRSTRTRSRAGRRQVRNWQRQLLQQIQRTILTKTEKTLRSKKSRALLDDAETDQLMWEIAIRWYFRGEDEKAFRIASAAASRSREHVAIADWTAGLAAWRLGRYEAAEKHFEALALASKSSDWNVAAGAYWAARANLVNNNPEEVTRWLRLGARHPRTFYGLLSMRLLGEDIDITWELPPLDEARFAMVRENQGVRRAMALAQVGQQHLAEREIRQLVPGASSQNAEVLLAVAGHLGLPGAAIQLGFKTLDPASRYYDAAVYPLPAWELEKGYSIDRALVFAFIRQESRFNTNAKSPAGARGLMQLMPRTASFVAKDRTLRINRLNELYNPQLNLDLGQRYLELLMGDKIVRGNLFMLAAAYNGGPGNLNKWQRQTNYADDPLLFIESIPARETRLFIERVLSNFWIYRLRLGQDVPSLDAVAAGHWPFYSALDGSSLLNTLSGAGGSAVAEVNYLAD
jgi:soluble lytic murein transglycosylase